MIILFYCINFFIIYKRGSWRQKLNAATVILNCLFYNKKFNV